MKKQVLLVGILCVVLFYALGQGVQASGLVTFEVKVLPGCKISSPTNLVFQPTAPGNSNIQDLEITVWSNIEWELSVKALGDNLGEGLSGIIEVGDAGTWSKLSRENPVFQPGRPPTGSEGVNLNIPFRFTSSYEDCPGDYSFQIEFTVVASL